MPLVVRRIEAVLRRMEKGGAGEEDTQLRYRDIVMDPDNYDVSVGGENVSLTAREFEILRLLMENQGRVFSRERFIAPLRPDLHPNGVHRGRYAGEIDKDLRRRCREYYLKNYGTEEQFRDEFFYSS